MKTLRQTLKRNVYGVAAVMFLAAATVPNLVVGHAHAAQITDRSIQMETATASATGQEYTITFDPATTGTLEAVIVDFCSNTPLIGETCNTPTGFDASSASVSSQSMSGTWVASTLNSDRTLVLTNATGSSVTGGTSYNFVVDGFVNPSDEGSFYARIITYDDDANVATHDATAPDAIGAHVDDGSVALSITENIDISAAVLETLTFCVTNTSSITADCGDAASNPPDLTLGSGSPTALSTSVIDTNTAYFQLSSNAFSPTVVRMAGDTLTSGSDDIDPVDGSGSISAGTENFGFVVDDANNSTVVPTTGSVSAAAPYDGLPGSDQYEFDDTAMNGTYGDIVAQSGGPVANVIVPVIFAATISPSTPAGLYTTSLSMIATGVY